MTAPVSEVCATVTPSVWAYVHPLIGVMAKVDLAMRALVLDAAEHFSVSASHFFGLADLGGASQTVFSSGGGGGWGGGFVQPAARPAVRVRAARNVCVVQVLGAMGFLEPCRSRPWPAS